MKTINVFGVASDYAKEIYETCNRLGIPYRSVDNLGIANTDLGILYHSIEQEGEPLIVAPGNPTFRAQAVAASWTDKKPLFVSLIDPTSVLASSAKVGCGVYVNALVSVGSNSDIACHANLNRSSSIGHDCTVGAFSSIGPGAIVCGSVKIGRETLIGAGAIVLPGLEIGNNCIIGAGSLVTKDLPSDTVALGSPAKVVGKTKEKSDQMGCPQC